MESNKGLVPSVNNLPSKEVKKVNFKIPKALKTFLFREIKADKNFQHSEKEFGAEITYISFIITPEKTFMRCGNEEKFIDTPLTEEEKKKMFKTFKVKEQTVKECKRIFLYADIASKEIHIKQTKFDGSVKEITL